ncbi:MAG TPA: hypothetical protein GX014_10205 [Firmicutes bacterium]|jgi:hypothetical protein|nr:hypothetical protein [Bacillota bacterium]
MTVQVLVYPVLIVLVGGFALLTVPREDLRLLLPYGVVLGGLYDYIHGVITGDLLKIGTFQNQHIFAVGDHLILTPIAWTFIMVLYLYYWPQRNKYIGWLYLLSWALLATGYSQVVRSAGLFTYLPWFYPIPMFLLFLIRFALATWVAQRSNLLQ